MCAVIEAEPSNVIKAMFEQVLGIVTQNGILEPATYNSAVEELTSYAESLEEKE